MYVRQVVPSLPIAAIAATLFCTAASAGAWIPVPGEYYSEIRGGVFSADSYHGTDGNRLPLLAGGLYEQRLLQLYNELGWKKNVAFVFGVPAVSVTRRTGGAGSSLTETGIGDLMAGLRLKLADGRTALALELDWNGPAGYRRDMSPRDALGHRFTVAGDTASGEVADVAELAPTLGAGQQDITGIVHFGTALPHGFVELSGGYRYRFEYEQMPSQMAAAADLGFWLGPSLLLGGRYQGAIAAGDADTPGDKVTVHLAGPILMYRVDDQLDVFAGSMHTASAENALHIDQVYVGLAVKHTRLNRLQGFLGGKRKS